MVWQNQNEGTELVPLIICELGMSADSQLTFLSFLQLKILITNLSSPVWV